MCRTLSVKKHATLVFSTTRTPEGWGAHETRACCEKLISLIWCVRDTYAARVRFFPLCKIWRAPYGGRAEPHRCDNHSFFVSRRLPHAPSFIELWPRRLGIGHALHPHAASGALPFLRAILPSQSSVLRARPCLHRRRPSLVRKVVYSLRVNGMRMASRPLKHWRSACSMVLRCSNTDGVGGKSASCCAKLALCNPSVV